MAFFVITACNHKQQSNNMKNTSLGKNDSILVTYFCGFMETISAIRCEELAAIQEQHPKNRYYGYFIPEGLRDAYKKDSTVLDEVPLKPLPRNFIDKIDTFIVDNTIVNRIIKLLDNRKKADDFSEDARMYVTIKRSNGKSDYLCFDALPNRVPNQVKYNSKSYSMDNELLFLLRYYSGYYSWFDKSNLDWFEELKDSVFYQRAIEQINVREKIWK